MKGPIKRYTSADGCVDAWIEQDSSIQLKAISKFGDPVELAAGEVRTLAENLKRLAELLDEMDQ
ncbi:hypothetical protein ACSFBF_13120 [Variovorax sp. ZT5P49]|uniref:hypothetical protein n=1 Tax=Variovorax sp. ZT5P49 TaxID=3443733 RepID=UPI003F449D8E